MQGKPRFFSQIYKISTSIKILFLGLTSLLFISCGGGGGGSVPTPPAPPTNIIATASYANTTCAIKAVSDATKGTLSCWGQMPDIVITDNSIGKAKRTFRVRATPEPMSTDANWIDVAIGRDHICGIKSVDSGNRLYCMGWNYNGQMGLARSYDKNDTAKNKYNKLNFHPVMIPVSLANDWIQLSAAGKHTCGIFGTGELKCWGKNTDGVLAQNTNNATYEDLNNQGQTNTVRKVLSGPSTPANATWLKVSTGDYHTCAIKKEDNTLWCWGRNNSNRLGLPVATPAVINKQFVTAVSIPAGFNATTDAWIDVSAGTDHTCAISASKDGATIPKKGTLWCWGDNIYRESGQKSGITIILPDSIAVGSSNNWLKVTAGNGQSCALNDLGRVFCFGYNAAVSFIDGSYPLTAVAGRNENWTSIKLGDGHGCGVKAIANSNGTESNLYCWGQQQFSQLGTGFSYNGYMPNLISNDNQPLADPFVWKRIDAGAYHTCGIKNDNSLWCWGKNYWGQLGIGNDLPTSGLVKASKTSDWKQVKSYYKANCARKLDNSLWCWGQNSDGQLGSGDTTRSKIPLQTNENGLDWDYTAVGKYHSCARKAADKSLWCWGDTFYGQLGPAIVIPAPSPTESTAKVQVPGAWKAGKIFAGKYNTCAIKDDATADLFCWGRNEFKEIQNSATPEINTPVVIPKPNNLQWIFASVGDKYICALANTDITATEGSLWCWGDNYDGTLGNKAHYDSIDWTSKTMINATRFIPVTTPFNVNTPGTAPGISTIWKQVTAHDENVCAIKSDGTLWCWGINYNGEHGTGNKVLSAAPVQEATKSNKWVMVKNGRNHTCGLQSQAGKTDYSLWCWGGRPFERQIGDLRLVDLQPKLVQ